MYKMPKKEIKEIYLFDGYENDTYESSGYDSDEDLQDFDAEDIFARPQKTETYTRTRCICVFCGIVLASVLITALIIYL